MNDAEKRAEMPKGRNSVLDRRTVVNGNANLLNIVKRGDQVLDVGCGSGAITKDIASLVGKEGRVTGIDTSDHLIRQARENFGDIENLTFETKDINDLAVTTFYDVVTSARVLQWLSNPLEILDKMKDHLKPGGCITILDYNHEKVEFSPDIPASMQLVYREFLRWRKDAGMDNQIADNLCEMFSKLDIMNISMEDYSEVSILGKDAFKEDLAIWIKVAEGRGPQLVLDGYITERQRTDAITEYQQWVNEEAKFMKLYLKAVSGIKR